MPWHKVQGGGDCGESEWAVIKDDDGSTAGCHETEAEADAQIAALYAAEPEAAQAEAPAPESTAVLTERWHGPIARSIATNENPSRDFTATAWTWRDPAESRMPLMSQTTTAMGHDDAALAGWITDLSVDGDGTVWAEGQFFDTEEGRGLRDALAAAERWGVSVDPGSAEWEDACVEEDEDGFCIKGVTTFLSYEIIGVTATPFPAFPDAWIELVGAEVVDAAESEAVEASALARPPSRFFRNPGFDAPAALTITDDGHVYGHVATFDQCHTGWNNTCVSAPDKVAMSLFHTGQVVTADGKRVATGPLIMGTDHPGLDPDLSAAGAIDHYAHTGAAWADVKLGTDEYGIWCAGALRPGLSDDQVRVLRASALSGDWRTVDGKLALVAVLSVNTPGFPIPRALAASGAPVPHETSTPLRFRMRDTAITAATGLGMVRCPECAKRALDAEAGQLLEATPDERIDEVLGLLRTLEQRTRVLNVQRREQLEARIRRVS